MRMHTPQNPMQTVIRRQMGIDAFSLDGDDSELLETWADRPRRKRTVLPPPSTR